MHQTKHKEPDSYHMKAGRTIIRYAGIIVVTALLYMVTAPLDMQAVQPYPLLSGLQVTIHNTEPAPDTIVTGKLTVTGGGIPLPPKPPFPPVTVTTGKLTATGGGIPVPSQPPFQGVTISTDTLKVSGRTR
jgi:hypothetical protein